MSCITLPYKETGFFSKIITDYLQQDEKIKPFYSFEPNTEGIKKAIEAKQNQPVDRALLVAELQSQYDGFDLTDLQQQNLLKLLSPDTFTICTAHQPNIFTGHLYFIYKILHVIKIANSLNAELSPYNFVPVFYMGSEDADLDELGNIHLNGQKLEWKTSQTGSVGRMKVDKTLLKLIDRIAGELEVEPHGKELIKLFREAYKEGESIQQATLKLVHELFKDFGLLIVVPDNANLKRAFNGVVKRELTEQFSHLLVEETSAALGINYKVQASGRKINLFYLTETRRERIEKNGARFEVEALNLDWSEEEILNELEAHSERFSANVILRAVFQEMILPNVAFIGGGGEVAYWLELKKVFEACSVCYPVLVLRNSFLLINDRQKEKAHKLGFNEIQLFKPAVELINDLVKRESNLQLQLDKEKEQFKNLYKDLASIVSPIDGTLLEHISVLNLKAQKDLTALEKKMLRAEKRKFEAQQRQVTKLKAELFPDNSLQERIDNFSTFYAKYGKELFQLLYKNSLTLEQQFSVVTLP